MSNKLVERQRLDSFLSVTGRTNLPEPQESESPDFVFQLGDRIVGIEVTGLVSPRMPAGDNPRQSARVLSELVRRIQTRYTELGGKRAHATVCFRRGLRVPGGSQADVAVEVAESLVAAVSRVAPKLKAGRPLKVPVGHNAVHSVALWPCDGGEVPRWHFHRGGPVSPARLEDVEATLKGKEAKLPLYRTRAVELWLLIVCDLFGDGLLIDPPRVPVQFTIVTGFDRVFCLDFTGSYVVEVPRRSQEDLAPSDPSVNA
jgi:hypothetical protein